MGSSPTRPNPKQWQGSLEWIAGHLRHCRNEMMVAVLPRPTSSAMAQGVPAAQRLRSQFSAASWCGSSAVPPRTHSGCWVMSGRLAAATCARPAPHKRRNIARQRRPLRCLQSTIPAVCPPNHCHSTAYRLAQSTGLPRAAEADQSSIIAGGPASSLGVKHHRLGMMKCQHH